MASSPSLKDLSGTILSLKNKELANGIINHHRSDDIGSKRIGGQHRKPFDQKTHQHGTDQDTDPRHGVKQGNLNDKWVSARLEYPDHIGNIRNHIGNEKCKRIADHRIFRAQGFIDRVQFNMHQANEMIFILQRRKQFPGG